MRHQYDVFCLAQKEKSSYVMREYVVGEVLADYLKHNPEVDKALFYEWVYQLSEYSKMTEMKHLTISPFHFIVNAERNLALINVTSNRNQFYLKTIKSNPSLEKFSTNHVGQAFGKTLQFILIQANILPRFTYWEKSKLKKILKRTITSYSANQKHKRHTLCIGLTISALLFFAMKGYVGQHEEKSFVPNWEISDAKTEEAIERFQEICENSEFSSEEKQMRIKELIQWCPELLETERYQSMQREYSVIQEGGKR